MGTLLKTALFLLIGLGIQSSSHARDDDVVLQEQSTKRKKPIFRIHVKSAMFVFYELSPCLFVFCELEDKWKEECGCYEPRPEPPTKRAHASNGKAHKRKGR